MRDADIIRALSVVNGRLATEAETQKGRADQAVAALGEKEERVHELLHATTCSTCEGELKKADPDVWEIRAYRFVNEEGVRQLEGLAETAVGPLQGGNSWLDERAVPKMRPWENLRCSSPTAGTTRTGRTGCSRR